MTVNWDKKPYTQSEFTAAWNSSRLVNDVAEALDTPRSTGSLRTLKRIAAELGLRDKHIWTRDFTPQQFTEAWTSSLTPQEAAAKLGAASTTGFEKMREALDLSPLTQKTLSYSKEQFIAVWEASETLDDVSDALNLAGSKQSLAQISKIAKQLGLPAKTKRIYTTATGEDASSIIADWIDWYKEHFGVGPLDTEIRALAHQVKELIKADYPTDSIKWGLFQWSLKTRSGYNDYRIVAQEAQSRFLSTSPQHQARVQQLTAISQGAETAQPMVIEAKEW